MVVKASYFIFSLFMLLESEKYEDFIDVEKTMQRDFKI